MSKDVDKVTKQIEEQVLNPQKVEFAKMFGDRIVEKARFLLDSSVGHETKLGKSLYNEVRENGDIVAIISPLPYFYPVEFGSRPHDIKVKNAKSLHWKDQYTGDDKFAKIVKHPGFQGIPFVRPAVHLVRNELSE